MRLFIACLLLAAITALHAQYKMEWLTRGVHAVNNGKGKVFVSWRLLGTENNSLAFNLYRTTNKKTVQLNKQPIITATSFTDESADINQANTYTVKTIINNKEERTGSSWTLAANAKAYVAIPLKTPAGYSANDASVGDMDGDGVYEIVMEPHRHIET